MTKMTFDQINDDLDAAIAEGVIYNVDFNRIKDAASRLLDAEIKAEVNEPLFYAGKFEDRSDNEKAIYDALGVCPVPAQWPSKKVIKLIDGPHGDNAVGFVVRALRDRWAPIREKLNTAKPLIVKGRKPSDTPRVTPERTLDNTGTCGCCGQNVKMDAAGKLVMHGFTIRYGFQEGKCPGVGFEPVEVSPAILHHMVELIDITLNSLTGMVEHHTEGQYPVPHPTRRATPKDDAQVHPDEQEYDRARRIFLANLDGQIQHVRRDRTDYETRIAAWEPRPLPGEKGVAR